MSVKSYRIEDTGYGRARKRDSKTSEEDQLSENPYHSVDDGLHGSPGLDWLNKTEEEPELRPTSEGEDLGDALYGLVPDRDADPVEEVRDLRRT